MATISGQYDQVNHDSVRITWAHVTEADDCAAFGAANGANLAEYDDRSVQVSGAFGGGSIALHGSNDGENFAILSDPTGVALSISAEKIRGVLEYVHAVKPVRTGGSSMDVTITLLAKRKRS